MTKLMGVLGHGIAYTRSPALHNRAAALLGIDVAYLTVDLPSEHVGPFLAAAWHMGAVGFNVTTPHKGLVASLYPDGGLASVNTLYRGDAGWKVASTDGPGFVRGLGRIGVTLAALDEVVILGNGGATAALLAHFSAVASSPLRVTVLRRDASKDPALAQAVGGSVSITFDAMTPAALAAHLSGKGPRTLLVQATSAPQRGDDLSSFVAALASYTGAVADLVYAKPSALYAAAKAKGLPAQDGEAMLIEQARLAQELWWGRAAEYDEMAAALGS